MPFLFKFSQSPHCLLRYYVLGAAIYLLDQWSKYWVLSLEGPVYISSWMNIVLVKNSGVIWGFSQSYGKYFALLGTVALIGVLFKTDLWQRHRYACALLIAGCLGNLTDRLYHGAVIDWIDWHAYGYHWPAFNVADSALFLALAIIFCTPHSPKKLSSRR